MLSIAYFLTTIKDRFQAADRERGATAVEYGLLVGLIAVVIIVAVTTLGGNLSAMFDDIATKLGGTTTTTTTA